MCASIVTKEQKKMKPFYAKAARLEKLNQRLSFVMIVKQILLQNLIQVLIILLSFVSNILQVHQSSAQLALRKFVKLKPG